MTRSFTDYLGQPASTLLGTLPFQTWSFERSAEDDLPDPRIYYSCEEHGLSVCCDANERIATIFLSSDGVARFLLGISLSNTRGDVRELFGQPSKSKPAHRQVVLGQYGPWDRFDKPSHSIHIEYELEADRIKMITLMRPDMVP